MAFPECFPASCTVMAGIDPTIPFASEGTGGHYLKEQMDIQGKSLWLLVMLLELFILSSKKRYLSQIEGETNTRAKNEG